METAQCSITPTLVCHEDEHLLVVNKPSGLNTHAPAPYAGDGVYDWLRRREPRWATLALVHRLDKDTSGVMVYAKTSNASRSLVAQFARHEVEKRYLFLTDRPVTEDQFQMKSVLVRKGDQYYSHVSHPEGKEAITRFEVLKRVGSRALIEARPITGRTHQIRVHAAAAKIPVLGDRLYGGSPFNRLCLHARQLAFRHPASGEQVVYAAPVDFLADDKLELRRRLIPEGETNAFRLIHGASDGWEGWFVDRFGDYLLSQSERPMTPEQRDWLFRKRSTLGWKGVYHKILTHQVARISIRDSSPKHVAGEEAPEVVPVLENSLRYHIRFREGYSAGLFLDQRENRRRLMSNFVADSFQTFAGPGAEALNTFAYTCSFSVCAALAGARVTSLDLSRKYLEWGRRNFALNDLDPAAHDFIFGDYFDWLPRLAKKGRRFELVILDPPTFSRSKMGAFQAAKDYPRLVELALAVLKPQGLLLCNANAARLDPETFVEMLTNTIRKADRRIIRKKYNPQPPDFPITRAQPAHLKSLWIRVE